MKAFSLIAIILAVAAVSGCSYLDGPAILESDKDIVGKDYEIYNALRNKRFTEESEERSEASNWFGDFQVKL